jgi:hypothetical protein
MAQIVKTEILNTQVGSESTESQTDPRPLRKGLLSGSTLWQKREDSPSCFIKVDDSPLYILTLSEENTSTSKLECARESRSRPNVLFWPPFR